jgi:hypothetical protein
VYLVEAEARRARLVEFLGINAPETKITVHLHPEWGIPDFRHPDSIDIYGFQTGRNGLIHELTHLLMRNFNNFLSEGLAVLTEEKFGWNLAFPNFLRPVNACLYSFIRDKDELSPLSILMQRRLWNPSEPELSQMRYLQAGSFAKYLVETYGLPPYLDVYRRSDFKGVYGRSLTDLEVEWLTFVRRGHLIQAWILAMSGVAVLVLTHLSISRGKSWVLPAVAGWLCFAAWSFYLAYLLRVPGALLAVIIIAGLVSRWHRFGGLVTLWTTGLTSLVVFILWSPLASFL